jgi:hypothetical protein
MTNHDVRANRILTSQFAKQGVASRLYLMNRQVACPKHASFADHQQLSIQAKGSGLASSNDQG